jgi:SAM-dependent methyltransferase
MPAHSPSRLPSPSALDRLDADACAALRARLDASGYASVLEEAEGVAPRQLDAVRLPLVHAALERRGGAGAVLARVFSYADRVRRDELESALGPSLPALLAGAGVVRTADGAAEAAYRLTALEGLYVLSDAPDAGTDAAMGPGVTTAELARLLPARPGAVLDLGCGAGSLALVGAARGARLAVGVDVSDRAIALARFNARLNASPARFHAGDLTAPVRTDRFDLVVGQPPYVAQPSGVAATTYLHGGARGDELALRFAAAAAGALAERGRALLFYDTPPGAEALHRQLRRALGDAPIDLIVLASPGPSADLQAAAYASLEDPTLGPPYRDAARRYRRHLEALGRGAFRRVLAVLTRSGVPGGRLTLELPISGMARLDAEVLDRFLRGLELAIQPDDALLAAAARLAPGGRVVEERAAGALGGDPARSVRFAPGGLAVDREVSEAGALVLAALDRSASVEDAAAQLAAACGEPPDALRRTVLDFVREGLGRGILAPA